VQHRVLVDLVGFGSRLQHVHARLDARLELLVLHVGEPGDYVRMLVADVLEHLVLDLVHFLALCREVAPVHADVLAAYPEHDSPFRSRPPATVVRDLFPLFAQRYTRADGRVCRPREPEGGRAGIGSPAPLRLPVPGGAQESTLVPVCPQPLEYESLLRRVGVPDA